jgi:hypothetical protein
LISEPTCSDGVKNGAETDVDCGGLCVPCGDGLKCMNDFDCKSGVCQSGSCQGEFLLIEIVKKIFFFFSSAKHARLYISCIFKLEFPVLKHASSL